MKKQKKTRHLPSSTPTGGALTVKLWTGEMHACGTFVYSEDEKRIVGYLRKSDRVATLQHLECVVEEEEECCESVFARTSRSIRSPSIVCVRFVCWVFCLFVMVMRMMNAVDAPCRR